MKHIHIVGAGIAGLWAGFLLSETMDVQITIYDAGDENLFHNCSWRAGGMLAPFCEEETAESEICEWGQRALKLWQYYCPNLVTVQGSLVLAASQNENQLRHFAQKTRNYRWVSELSALEPHLANRFVRVLFYPGEGHLEPRKVLRHLIQILKSRNVRFIFQTSLDIDYTRFYPDADILVDCRGLSAKNTLPLRGVKGEMLVVRSQDIEFKRPIRLLHPRHPLYVVPRGQGLFMIGATTIESETDTSFVTVRSAGELLTQLYNIHPAFAEAEVLEMNVGLRPAFKDHFPYLKTIKNIFIINGLYRHGYLLAPYFAWKLCDILKFGVDFAFNKQVENV